MHVLLLLALGYWTGSVLTAKPIRQQIPSTISEHNKQACLPEVDCDIISFLTEDDGENDKLNRKSSNDGEKVKSRDGEKPTNDGKSDISRQNAKENGDDDKNRDKYRDNGRRARRKPRNLGSLKNSRPLIRSMNYGEFLAMLHASNWLKKIKVNVDIDD